MAIWAVVGEILKAAGKKALEAAAANALGHMGLPGQAMEGFIGQRGGASQDRQVAQIGDRKVMLSDTRPPAGQAVGNAIGSLIGNNMRFLSPQSQPLAMSSGDDYATRRIDDAGQKVLLPNMMNGRQLSEQEALSNYRLKGDALGKFGSDYELEEFVKKMKAKRNIYGFGGIG